MSELSFPKTVDPCRNFSKIICAIFFGDSHARIRDGQQQVAFADPRRAVTTIRPPSGVNLIALDNRLVRICWTFP